MTPADLKRARLALGLTRAGMARMTETDVSSVKRWEMDPAASTARGAPMRVGRLISAYLDGWRPDDWPDTGDAA